MQSPLELELPGSKEGYLGWHGMLICMIWAREFTEEKGCLKLWAGISTPSLNGRSLTSETFTQTTYESCNSWSHHLRLCHDQSSGSSKWDYFRRPVQWYVWHIERNHKWHIKCTINKIIKTWMLTASRTDNSLMHHQDMSVEEFANGPSTGDFLTLMDRKDQLTTLTY
jgi:hypothetical protein